jgi:hypothetical protein
MSAKSWCRKDPPKPWRIGDQGIRALADGGHQVLHAFGGGQVGCTACTCAPGASVPRIRQQRVSRDDQVVTVFGRATCEEW